MLFYACPLPLSERKKLDTYLLLSENSNTWKYLNLEIEPGRSKIDQCLLFAAVLHCFVLGKASLREMEVACFTDLRIIYLIGEAQPNRSSFSRFITDLVPKISFIFAALMKRVFMECSKSMNTVYLDGSKFEANANKYKFVWRPTIFHLRLCEKVANLLRLMHLEKGLPEAGIIPSKIIMEKLADVDNVSPALIEGGQNTLAKMRRQLSGYLLKALEYEEKEAICGEHRNSYYKTDHDATATCLKEDYYSGLGSQMHAAYNAQIVVSNGFVVSYYVSQDRTAIRTLQPAMEQYYRWYGTYPERLCADAGYGSLANYEYCDQKGIKAFIKYGSWNREKTVRNPATYEYVDENTFQCLGERKEQRVEPPPNYRYKSNSAYFYVKDCSRCNFGLYCRRYLKNKSQNSRLFEIHPRYALLKQQARDLLLSPEAIEMRVNRSCQVEGVFGAIKQNMEYTRFHRRSRDRVTVEFALTSTGLNVRKYLKFVESEKVPFYWSAQRTLEPETFKKPSAKKIENRINKREKLQPNEIAKKLQK